MHDRRISRDEELFVQLVSSFATSAWIALGKLKNPVTDRVERNLNQASHAIDMLDMIANKMAGNLSDEEHRLLSATIGDLKLNYVEELNRAEKEESKGEGEQEERKKRTEPDESGEEQSDDNERRKEGEEAGE